MPTPEYADFLSSLESLQSGGQSVEEMLEATTYIIGKALTDETVREALLSQTGAPDLPTLAQWLVRGAENAWTFTQTLENMRTELENTTEG